MSDLHCECGRMLLSGPHQTIGAASVLYGLAYLRSSLAALASVKALAKMRDVQTSNCKNCGARIFRALTPEGRVEAFDAQLSAYGPYKLKQDVGDLVAMKDATSPGARFELHQSNCRGITAAGSPYR